MSDAWEYTEDLDAFLDDLMMPHRFEYTRKQMAPDATWSEIYDWLDANCGPNKWYHQNGEFCFTREEQMTLFILRWT
jgi:hypothetical protein